MAENYFLQMIKVLRETEEVILYTNVLDITEAARGEVTDYLQVVYEDEMFNFPFQPPAFHAEAALWAAETAYLTAQFIIYRQHTGQELTHLFPDVFFTIDAGSMLSVDLCFRFIPDMLSQLKMMDSEDPLIPLIEEKLLKFHYSGIKYPLSVESLDASVIGSSKCLEQLYINRIIACKNNKLANHPAMISGVKASLGMHANQYWKEFNLTELHE